MPNTFTNENTYSGTHFVYGFCNGNDRTAAVEYWQHYPHSRRSKTAQQILRKTGSFPQANARHEQQWCGEGDIQIAVQSRPNTSMNKISRATGAAQI
jgi:hypothetical protein